MCRRYVCLACLMSILICYHLAIVTDSRTKRIKTNLWQWQLKHSCHHLNSQKTPYSSPLRANYRASVVSTMRRISNKYVEFTASVNTPRFTTVILHVQTLCLPGLSDVHSHLSSSGNSHRQQDSAERNVTDGTDLLMQLNGTNRCPWNSKMFTLSYFEHNVSVLVIQYIPRNMHTVFALLCFVVVIHWLIFPYPSGLLHWHCGNLTIVPVPAKQPWWIWINTSCEFIMNDCIITTKQSTTKPCAYFLGYTVWCNLIWGHV